VNLLPQALRIALEFEQWYLFKIGHLEFRQFADAVLRKHVSIGGAEIELCEIRVLSTDDRINNKDSPEDFRWAFGRLLAGDARARVNNSSICQFLHNWVKIKITTDDLRRSHCLRRALYQSIPHNKRGIWTTWQDATDELLRVGESSWYNKGLKLPFVGLEIVDLEILRSTLIQRGQSVLATKSQDVSSSENCRRYSNSYSTHG